jgi:hypothetical protein
MAKPQDTRDEVREEQRRSLGHLVDLLEDRQRHQGTGIGEEMIRHKKECAYAGLPIDQRDKLPWPAGEDDMCICRPHKDYTQKENDMTRPNAQYLEARLKLLVDQAMQVQEELQQARQLEEKLGTNDDYKDGDVIKWEQRYDNGKTYTFVAIKAAGYWYTTGIFQRSRWSWETLVENHLSKAVEGSIVKMRKGKVIA